MGVYCDTPRWERWHGLSGHLIADSTAELQDFANRLGIGIECASLDSVVPHYQIVATLQPVAIAAGAVLLSRDEFSNRIRSINRAQRPMRLAPPARNKRRKKPRVSVSAVQDSESNRMQQELF